MKSFLNRPTIFQRFLLFIYLLMYLLLLLQTNAQQWWLSFHRHTAFYFYFYFIFSFCMSLTHFVIHNFSEDEKSVVHRPPEQTKAARWKCDLPLVSLSGSTTNDCTRLTFNGVYRSIISTLRRNRFSHCMSACLYFTTCGCELTLHSQSQGHVLQTKPACMSAWGSHFLLIDEPHLINV